MPGDRVRGLGRGRAGRRRRRAGRCAGPCLGRRQARRGSGAAPRGGAWMVAAVLRAPRARRGRGPDALAGRRAARRDAERRRSRGAAGGRRGLGAGPGQAALAPLHLRDRARSKAMIYAATLDCKGCGACLKTCPERALRPAPGWFEGPPLLTLIDKCTGCGECLEICPADAFVALAPEEALWPAA